MANDLDTRENTTVAFLRMPALQAPEPVQEKELCMCCVWNRSTIQFCGREVYGKAWIDSESYTEEREGMIELHYACDDKHVSVNPRFVTIVDTDDAAKDEKGFTIITRIWTADAGGECRVGESYDEVMAKLSEGEAIEMPERFKESSE